MNSSKARSALIDVAGSLPAVALMATDAIRREVPAYAVVDRAEHTERVAAQFRALLAGLGELRLPAETELEQARSLGAQRAEQGLEVPAVTSAYHVGYRELWRQLATLAREEGATGTDDLIDLVDLVWSWVEAVSSASAEGHAAATRAHDARRLDLGHQLVSAVLGGEDDLPRTALLARTIGFDPSNAFHVACVLDQDSAAVDGLRQSVPAGGTAHVDVQGQVLLIIAQGATLRPWLERVMPTPVVAGLGLPRPGLNGLRQAIGDAQDALALARQSSTVVEFADAWPRALVLRHREQLAPLLTRPQADPAHHLGRAVIAYADAGFSIVGAGQRLHLHPNSVRYRLDRWHQLTGWDARSRDGLLTSLAALSLGPWGTTGPGRTYRPELERMREVE